MKKTSILLASSIMILAVIVAIVGVTAAWFGNQYTYNGVVNVSSEDPKNNAIIVQGSASVDSLGENPVLTPAKILPGLILSDVDGSKKYESVDVLKPNASLLSSVATKVTVTFDFVYNGGASNDDGTTTMYIELVSVTLKNPHHYVDEEGNIVDPEEHTGEMTQVTDYTLPNYREEFALSMFITTTDSSVMMFTNSEGQTLYTQKTKEVKEGDTTVTITYYELNDDYYIADDNKHRVSFNMIPVTHTLNATIYFIHVDELTPPELIDAQLFLNFQVSFKSDEQGEQ